VSEQWSRDAAEAMKDHFCPPGMTPVMFNCQGCGLKNEVVNVEARKTNEDIVKWMKKVTSAVNIRHTMKSMSCTSTKCDLVIPLPKDGNFIGAEQGGK